MRRGLSRHSNKSSGNFFSPLSLFAGGVNGVWYDPSDSSTLFEDTAGTTPSPTPGAGALSVVGKMLDKSGNGNHAISYNTTTARPELSARVNLLTYSEQFDNAAWNKNGITVAGADINATTAPDGTLTADRIRNTATVGNHDTYEASSTLATAYTFSTYLKADGVSWACLIFQTPDGINRGCFFDLANGALGTSFNSATGTISAVSGASGWYRCTVTATAPLAGTSYSLVCVATANGSSRPSYSGDTSQTIFAWGADLRPANIGTSVPAYQRIADAYTYDSSGFPRYLVFNGTASGMYTPANLNLSGTDKATVFAGVRKNAETTFGMIAELSAVDTNAGIFYLGIPNAAQKYEFASRGTAIAYAGSASTYTPPISNVLTGIGNISGPASTLRINGTQVANITTSQGTGNYGTYPLYVGSRNNSSLFFNGNIYSLIVVGAASTAAQISSTESWINVKEGTVY